MSYDADFESSGPRVSINVPADGIDDRAREIVPVDGNSYQPWATPPWREFPVEQRPESPRAEYLRHACGLTKSCLIYRWQGLGYDREIAQIFNEPMHERARMMCQAAIAGGAAMPNMADPDIIRNLSNWDAVTLTALKAAAVKRLDENVIVKKKVVWNSSTGRTVSVEVPEEMTPGERLQEGRLIALLDERIRLAQGQATLIMKTDSTETRRMEMDIQVNTERIHDDPAQARALAAAAALMNARALPPATAQVEEIWPDAQGAEVLVRRAA